MECLHCGKKIGVLRKLQDQEFCSAAHRKAYHKKQDELALDFLLRTKPRFEPIPADRPAPEPQTAPIAAGFATESACPSRLTAEPLRNAEPLDPAPATVLPAARARVSGPSLPGCRFVRVTLPADLAVGQSHRSALSPVRLPLESVCWRAPNLHPLWFESAPKARSKAEAAGFTRIQMAWMRPAAEMVHACAASAFPAVPAPARTQLALARPAFPLAGAARPRVEVAVETARAPACATTTWQWASPALHTPDTAAPLLCATGFRMCEPLQANLPAVHTAPASNAIAIAGEPAISPWQLLIPTPPITFAAPALGPAPRVPIGHPRHSVIRAEQAAGRSALVWRFQIRLGDRSRVIAPDPRAFANHTVPPTSEPVAPPLLRVRIADRWRFAPKWSRRLALWLPMSTLVLFGAFQLATTVPAREVERALQSRIKQRAAIEFQDDFRSGLSRWSGAADWAKSWSYDPAGFARPGRLALLAGTETLADYRFEFLGEIDKKAVGWVFRAADARNYYATKLVASKRGPETAFFIVRYAVIDGHERLKMQLPLPLAASAKTLHRVRVEVRGTEFTTYIDGQVADTWSDASLARGGIGFFADPGEAAYIRWVNVANQDDFLGRFCSYLSPSKRR